ncbi:MAG: P-loop NTPase family protein [Pirellulaceae bacterium]
MNCKVSQVFGVSSEPVASYIERSEVDSRFLDALKSDKQVVVYGASKQGKTALVSRHLPYDTNIVVSLTPRTSVLDVYHSILRQSGIVLKTGETQGSETEATVGVAARFKALIPIFGGAEGETTGKFAAGSNREQEFEEIPINLELPQDVSEVLRRAGRDASVVILENFHYLDEERQRQLAFDLRTFQELKVQFVILGVWREKNRLAQFNGDLLDRVTEVPVEPWTQQEFIEVAEKGAKVLNVSFSPSLRAKLVEACFASIGVFQELLKETCLAAGVNATVPSIVRIDDENFVVGACRNKASEYGARHQRALESIAAGNVSSSTKEGVQPLFLPYYLVRVILSEGYDGLASGMRRSVIQERIQAIHHRPQDVRASDMSNLLYNLARTQANKSISPPIIDYDQSKRMLQIVDSTFYFFLKHADLKQIDAEIPNPMEQ